MLTLNGNDIHLTRGDTAYLKIDISDTEGFVYTIKNGDILTITVNNISGSNVISKSVDADNVIVLNSEDTKRLKIGRYKYDIQLTTSIGEIFTIIPKSNFYLEEEVTK